MPLNIRISFQKCGISVSIDGSNDDEININSLPNYKVWENKETECELEESDAFENDEDPDGEEY